MLAIGGDDDTQCRRKDKQVCLKEWFFEWDFSNPKDDGNIIPFF